MSKFISIFLGLVLCLFSSCTSEKKSPIQSEQPEKITYSLDWMLGTWQCPDENGMLYEKWEVKNDSTWLGQSYFIENEDTIFFEHLRIRKHVDTLIYESLGDDLLLPKVKLYKGFISTANSLNFLNEEQAFPKSIRYNALTDTTLMMELSGEIDGMEETQPYQLIKIQ